MSFVMIVFKDSTVSEKLVLVLALILSFILGMYIQSFETKRVRQELTEACTRGPECRMADGTVYSRTCHLPTWKQSNPNAEIIYATNTGSQDHYVICWREKEKSVNKNLWFNRGHEDLHS